MKILEAIIQVSLAGCLVGIYLVYQRVVLCINPLEQRVTAVAEIKIKLLSTASPLPQSFHLNARNFGISLTPVSTNV